MRLLRLELKPWGLLFREVHGGHRPPRRNLRAPLGLVCLSEGSQWLCMPLSQNFLDWVQVFGGLGLYLKRFIMAIECRVSSAESVGLSAGIMGVVFFRGMRAEGSKSLSPFFCRAENRTSTETRNMRTNTVFEINTLMCY